MSGPKRTTLIWEWEDVPLTAYFETATERTRRWARERYAMGMVAYHGKPRWELRPYECDKVSPLCLYRAAKGMVSIAPRLQSNEYPPPRRRLTPAERHFQRTQRWANRNYRAWYMRKRGGAYPAIAERIGLSKEHTRQIVLKQNRIQLQLWRNPPDTRIIRGESPIHDEPWTEYP